MLKMRYVETCNNCGATDFEPFAYSVSSEQLHFGQCRCRACGLIFSNPQCDPSVLSDYYGRIYYEEHWQSALATSEEATRAAIEHQAHEVGLIKRYVSSGKVLEIGSGTGSFLAAMREAGFDPHGVELSHAAVEHARTVHGLNQVQEGSFDDATFAPHAFDLVYAWHVIEHVTDLDRFLRHIAALLRPGGIIWIGTENYRNAGQALAFAGRLVRGLPPPFATSPEHTYVFSVETLSDVVRRRGFTVLACEAYQPSWQEKMQTMRFRSILGRGYFFGQHLANRIGQTGPLLRLVARS